MWLLRIKTKLASLSCVAIRLSFCQVIASNEGVLSYCFPTSIGTEINYLASGRGEPCSANSGTGGSWVPKALAKYNYHASPGFFYLLNFHV